MEISQEDYSPNRSAETGTALASMRSESCWRNLRRFCVGCALLGCNSEPTRRRSVEDPGVAIDSFDGGARSAQSVLPRENTTAVEHLPAVEVVVPQCPGMRMYRVDRRLRGTTTLLVPRFYGRDDVGRYWTLEQVLLCELRYMRWVIAGWPEGNNMLLWRGPYLFQPEDDCVWREPVVSGRTEQEGRWLRVRERCHGHPERSVRVVVDRDYRSVQLLP